MTINRLLIVGAGSIGQRHARLARQLLPNADIRVLRRSAAIAVPGTDGSVSNLDEALAFRPQAAVVASASVTHVDYALALARAGVHLLVEKPLDADVAKIPDLLSAVSAAGIVLMVGYNLRFLPSLQLFRKAIREGHAGRVLSVRAEVGQYLPSWRPNADYRNSVSAKRSLGGGVLLELSHEIDYLQWIFGPIQWVKAGVFKQSDLEIDVEDCAHLILGFAPDNTGAQVVGRLDMDFIRQDTVRECLAIGEAGTLRWNALTGKVDFYAAGMTEWREVAALPHHGDDSYIAEWRHFLACIEGAERVLVTGEEAYRTLQVIDAIRTSANQSGIACAGGGV